MRDFFIPSWPFVMIPFTSKVFNRSPRTLVETFFSIQNLDQDVVTDNTVLITTVGQDEAVFTGNGLGKYIKPLKGGT